LRESENVVNELDKKLKKVLVAVDEKLEVESIAQLVEHLDSNGRLDQRMQQSLQNLWQAVQNQEFRIGAIQIEIRDLIMDVALLKRALSSLGQVGVLERQRIEKELVLDLFPPRLVRTGTGVVVAPSNASDVTVDCENRLPLCKAACCRIFNVLLVAEEIEGNRYDWNPRAPYTLHKNRLGCVHLRSGDWSCSIHGSRPSTCSGYNCANDQRIWADFEKAIINPDLRKELDKLDGGPVARQTETAVTSKKETPVSPPDFSELRNKIAPEPTNKFVAREPAEAESPTNANGDVEVG
jgi:hypothetical protein